DVGVHVTLVSAIEVERIDLEDLDQQAGDVLDMQIEPHRFLGGEISLVGGREINVDTLLELAEKFRRQLRCPLLGVAQPVDDLGLREQALEVNVIDIGLKLLERIGRSQKVQEVATDQLFVVADDGEQRHRSEVCVQIGRI